MNNDDLKNILKEINYKKYEDLFKDYAEQKVTIGLSNNACRLITQTEKPVFAVFGVFIGIIPSIIITIYFAITSSKYLLLLLILLELILPFQCYTLDNFKIKTRYIAYILLIIDFFITKLPNPITIIYLSIICCSLGIEIWKDSLFNSSIKIMKERSDAFVWAYNSHNLYIEDNKGNHYTKKFDINN